MCVLIRSEQDLRSRFLLKVSVPFLSRKKDARLVLLGLANAGKTTLLYRMKYGKMIQANPTPVPGDILVRVVWRFNSHYCLVNIY